MPGQSGNPRGRPRGTGRTSKLRRAIENDLQEIIQTLAFAAKSGDVGAAKLLLDRALPSLRPVEVAEALPLPVTGSLQERAEGVLAAMGRGEVGVGQASDVLAALGAVARLREIEELERRILALENRG